MTRRPRSNPKQPRSPDTAALLILHSTADTAGPGTPTRSIRGTRPKGCRFQSDCCRLDHRVRWTTQSVRRQNRLSRRCRFSGRRRGDRSCTDDATTLPLRRATPDTVVDPVLDRVLQALDGHWAPLADGLGLLDTHAVGGEEERRWLVGTVPLSHPLGIRGSIHRSNMTLEDRDLFHQEIHISAELRHTSAEAAI